MCLLQAELDHVAEGESCRRHPAWTSPDDLSWRIWQDNPRDREGFGSSEGVEGAEDCTKAQRHHVNKAKLFSSEVPCACSHSSCCTSEQHTSSLEEYMPWTCWRCVCCFKFATWCVDISVCIYTTVCVSDAPKLLASPSVAVWLPALWDWQLVCTQAGGPELGCKSLARPWDGFNVPGINDDGLFTTDSRLKHFLEFLHSWWKWRWNSGWILV